MLPIMLFLRWDRTIFLLVLATALDDERALGVEGSNCFETSNRGGVECIQKEKATSCPSQRNRVECETEQAMSIHCVLE